MLKAQNPNPAGQEEKAAIPPTHTRDRAALSLLKWMEGNGWDEVKALTGLELKLIPTTCAPLHSATRDEWISRCSHRNAVEHHGRQELHSPKV